MHGGKNTAGIAVEEQFRPVVAYRIDYFAYCCGNVDVCVAFYLAGDNGLSGGDESFAGYFCLRIACQKFIEYSVGYLVGYLVGVACRYGFGCEEIAHSIIALFFVDTYI